MKSLKPFATVRVVAAVFSIASLVATSVTAMAIFPSCKKETADSAQTAQTAPKVKTLKIKTESITPELATFGSLSFLRKADIVATVEGKITELRADVGKRVKKGEVLAILSNIQVSIREQQALAALAQATAALEQAQTRYREAKLEVEARLISLEKAELLFAQKERELAQMARTLADKKELFTVGGVTGESMDAMELNYSSALVDHEALRRDIEIQKIGFRDADIKSLGLTVPSDPAKRKTVLLDVNTRSALAQLHVAEAQVTSARTELASTRQLLTELKLSSPIDGIMGARYLERGEKAQADAKVFTVFDADEVDVAFHVPENIGIYLVDGMKVEVTIDTLDKGIFEASIRQVSPMVDPQTGNITVKALMAGKDKRLKPGMFARVRVVYGEARDSILIPQTSIFKKQDDKAVVFLAVNGRAFQKEITLGESKGDRIVVLEGLKAGDLVIDSPSPIIREGEDVDVQA